MVIGWEQGVSHKKIEVKAIERMEITMEGQQIQNASIVGKISVKSEGFANTIAAVQIEDPKWVDSQKV